MMSKSAGSSLYIHIPYCRRKCLYCDFFSGGASIADYHRLVDALLNELSQRKGELIPSDHSSSASKSSKIVSIYFGGGTPSCLPPEEFKRLSCGIKEIIGERNLSYDCEITIEVNPDDVNPENIDAWKQSGVNRVSIGIQSLNDVLLKKIGRLHTADTSLKAISLLKSNFENISCDLMFGLPGQTIEDVSTDLNKIISLKPAHISVYSLMYEEGTALTALRDAGRIEETDESLSLQMFSLISDSLIKNGFRQYEISNYSIPGRESRHNSGYWTGRPYLGIGPSAHSYDGDAVRRANPWQLKEYLHHYAPADNNESPESPSGLSQHPDSFYKEEHLSQKEKTEEMIMLRLRMASGLPLYEYESRFGTPALNTLLNIANSYINTSHMKIENGHLSLTPRGVMISDNIISSLLPD